MNGDWNRTKGKINPSYGDLTNVDLNNEEGKNDELVGRLQKKIGKTKDDVIKWIENF